MASNFTYYTPTEVVFGKDTEREAGRLVKHQAERRFCFITAQILQTIRPADESKLL